MHSYHGELTYEEGFQLLNKQTHTGYHFRSQRIMASSGWGLYSAFKSAPTCPICGLQADRWVILTYHKSGQKYPIIELYGVKDGVYVQFNRDHIIPRSLGGKDRIENYRATCSSCNFGRGNYITEADIEFMDANPNLFCVKRYHESRNRILKAAKRMANLDERRKYMIPIEMMDAFLSTRADYGISCQIAAAPVKKNKKPVKKPAVIQSENWVLITNLFELARIRTKNIRMKYQQVDGQTVGPFVREQDRV